MSRFARRAVAVLLLSQAFVTTSSAISPSATVTTLMSGWERHFSVDWTAEPDTLGGRRLAGYLHNRHGEFAVNVRLLAQALDGADEVVGQRIAWIPGGVAGGSRIYFEIPRLPAAARYRVTVWEYTWLQSQGDRS